MFEGCAGCKMIKGKDGKYYPSCSGKCQKR